MTETTYEHVILDEQEVPWIEGTTIKVVELVLERQAYGGTPEQLHDQHPMLTLGQIYSALAYYEDHKAVIDADIERRLRLVEQIERTTPPSTILSRLRNAKQY